MTKDIVKCWNCKEEFDLVKSDWCDCDYPTQTKICPHCQNCLCANPELRYEDFTEAPEILKAEGFAELWKAEEHNISA